MFWTAVIFIVSMFVGIADKFVNWRIAGDLTLGGFLFGMLISSILIATVRAAAGLNEISTMNSAYYRGQQDKMAYKARKAMKGGKKNA